MFVMPPAHRLYARVQPVHGRPAPDGLHDAANRLVGGLLAEHAAAQAGL